MTSMILKFAILCAAALLTYLELAFISAHQVSLTRAADALIRFSM